jgi:CheY-like chemotaxis protein
MNDDVLIAFVAILPQLIVVAAAIIAAVWLRRPIGSFVDRRVAGFGLFGFRLDLRAAEVDEAVLARAQAGLEQQSVTGDGRQVEQRARRLRDQLVGRTVLWVDDHPGNNQVERRMLRRMGIFTECAITNDEAIRALDHDTFDLVISDVARDSGPNGLELLSYMNHRAHRMPVILYIGHVDPSRAQPLGAFGITDRPDVLLNLVMDALDRR